MSKVPAVCQLDDLNLDKHDGNKHDTEKMSDMNTSSKA